MDIEPGRFYGGAVSSPSDPQRPGKPDDATVVVPTGQQPQRGYGQQYPPPGQGAHPAQNPGYQQPPTSSYNPYGQQQYPDYSQFPAAFPADVPPARRPGSLYVALLLFVLATLPFLGGAAAILIGGATIQSMIPAEQLAEFETLTGVNVVSLVVGLGVFIGVVALLYLIFVILAVVGRNWARILTTIMTVIFLLIDGFFVLAGITAGGAAAANDPSLAGPEFLVGLLVVAAPGILALIGMILLFLPGANRFYAARR